MSSNRCDQPWWKRHGWMLAVTAGVVLFQLVVVVLYTDGSVDAAYYVAESTLSAFKNRLGRYDVDTGQKLTSFNIRYVYNAFPMHNAAAARLSGLAAIIQARVVMPAVNVLMANLVYYRLGRALLSERDEQSADLFVCIMFVINLYANTIYLPGAFLFTRLYEGKSMVANIVLPAVLCCGVRLWSCEDDRTAWIWMFLAGGAGMCFAGTGMITLILAFACLVPVAIRRRSFRCTVKAFWSITPIIVWLAVYAATKIGWISLAIN